MTNKLRAKKLLQEKASCMGPILRIIHLITYHFCVFRLKLDK